MIDPAWLKARAADVRRADTFDPELYQKYNVKRGLRNADGTGVLVGLTTIGAVHGYVVSEGEKEAVPGQLFYRGINVVDLARNCQAEGRFGFEECAYLLLFGELPTREKLEEWTTLLAEHRRLPDGFKEKAIIRAPGKDLMNSLARAVLTAYTYDTAPDLLDLETNLRQAVELIAGFPTMVAYAYQAKATTTSGIRSCSAIRIRSRAPPRTSSPSSAKTASARVWRPRRSTSRSSFTPSTVAATTRASSRT